MSLLGDCPRAVRALSLGAAVEHVGVFVSRRENAPEGLSVSVEGSALDRGLVELTRARARPFAASPPPWSASGWEHTLARDPNAVATNTLSCELRSFDVRARGAWVALLGVTQRAGRGELRVTVGEGPTAVRRAFELRVGEPSLDRRTTLRFEGASPWPLALSALTSELRRCRRLGALAPGDSLSWRAVRDRSPGELLGRSTLTPETRWTRSSIVREVTRAARSGAFATLEVRRDPPPNERGESFELTLSRRRGRSGDWGVELCSVLSASFAR